MKPQAWTRGLGGGLGGFSAPACLGTWCAALPPAGQGLPLFPHHTAALPPPLHQPHHPCCPPSSYAPDPFFLKSNHSSSLQAPSIPPASLRPSLAVGAPSLSPGSREDASQTPTKQLFQKGWVRCQAVSSSGQRAAAVGWPGSGWLPKAGAALMGHQSPAFIPLGTGKLLVALGAAVEEVVSQVGSARNPHTDNPRERERRAWTQLPGLHRSPNPARFQKK